MDINIHAGDLFLGDWQHEISWEIYDSDDNDVIAGGAPQELRMCIREGNYHVEMSDSWADGWHDNVISFSLPNGNSIASCTCRGWCSSLRISHSLTHKRVPSTINLSTSCHISRIPHRYNHRATG